MTKSEHGFPFTAVVGQDGLRTALILAAINPETGGLLISGPRGSAKSTVARGLAPLLPNGEGAFVTLPLGTTEDKLIGSLDLQRVLDDKRVNFNPGLLQRAHGGVLYVDEVNLLPDTLVDILLDVAASGVNHVERDGISHAHPAEFLLVGTMNPDEGELRPQLKDRFGLAVELADNYDRGQRMAIVRQRLAFEQDRDGFMEAQEPDQHRLREAIAQGRARLPSVTVPGSLQEHIAERCLEAGVEGVRADLNWHRAARAHAAWDGRDNVSGEDIAAVEDFVLCHRRKQKPPTSSTPPPASPPPEPTRGDSEQADGDWGALPPQTQACGPERSLDLRDAQPPSSRASGQQPGHSARGNADPVTSRQHQRIRGESRQIDWFRTFALAENQGAKGLQRLAPKPSRPAGTTLNCIVLDTSASTLGQRALAQAKGLVLGIARQAYLKRQLLSILAFGGQRVEWVLARQRAPKDCTALLDDLPAGGGTPLRQALDTARRWLVRQQRREPALRYQTLLLTDARSRDAVAGLGWPSPLYVIDTEQGRVRLNRARRLAAELNGHYLPLSAAPFIPTATAEAG